MQLYASTRLIGGVEVTADPLPPDSGRSNAFWLDFP